MLFFVGNRSRGYCVRACISPSFLLRVAIWVSTKPMLQCSSFLRLFVAIRVEVILTAQSPYVNRSVFSTSYSVG